MTEPKTLLLIGATSDIGYAAARAYAKAGWSIMLASRNADTARRNAADLAVRSQTGEVPVFELDILDTGAFKRFLDNLPVLPDTALCVVGELGGSPEDDASPEERSRTIRINFEGPALLLEEITVRMAQRGSGTIVGVSSVAGDRGRAQNYVYGSAKAGFSAFLSGLRNRFFGSGVHVLTVKPGFVNTRMTSDMSLPALLTAEPDHVGGRIYEAAEVKKSDAIYVLRRWRPVMMVIKALPEFVFKRLKL